MKPSSANLILATFALCFVACVKPEDVGSCEICRNVAERPEEWQSKMELGDVALLMGCQEIFFDRKLAVIREHVRQMEMAEANDGLANEVLSESLRNPFKEDSCEDFVRGDEIKRVIEEVRQRRRQSATDTPAIVADVCVKHCD